ncbi:MAG: hypothetical protein HYW23_01045 [Candidatus Aenigmarchaeota archaeon]|nr:hypothetical protein [Candidatus Aenigmarchaeota archaeon]
MNNKLNDVIKFIQKTVSKYNKNDLLYWLSATSILPGNEVYQSRFEFLIQTILSLEDTEFKNNKVSQDVIRDILTQTNLLDWFIREDWTPIPLKDRREIFLSDKHLKYFPSDLEFPDNLIKRIFSTFYLLEDSYKASFKYSPLNEIENLLLYQNDLIDFILQSNNYSKFDKFNLPNEIFVVDWKNILIESGSPFSNVVNTDISVSGTLNAPDQNWFNGNSAISYKPIYENKIILPNLLIFAFYYKIINDLKKFINDDIRRVLHNKLLYDTTLSIVEQVPIQAVVTDFKINKMDEKLELGITYDDKIFIISVIEDKFDQNLFEKSLSDIQNTFEKVNLELQKSNISLDVNGEITCFEGNLEPIFLIIFGELDALSTNFIITENKTSSKNLFIIPQSCLNYIFEDLNDKKSDLIFFTKILRKNISMEKHIFSFTFCDFYQIFSNGFKSFHENNQMIFLYPHSWSDAENQKIKIRPCMDLRPYVVFPPFSFKIEKLDESTFYGYNKLFQKSFWCFKNSSKIYFLIDHETLSEEKEYKIIELYTASFLSELYSHILEKTSKLKLFLSNKDKIINLMPSSWAMKNKLIDNDNFDFKVGINPQNKSEFLLIFNPNKINENPDEQIDQAIKPLFSIMDDLVKKEDISKFVENVINLDLKSKFNVSKVPHFLNMQYEYTPYFPTIIDESDIELFILNFAKENNIKDGIYNKTDAHNIINNVVSKLESELKEKLSKYNLKSIVKLAYSEYEKSLISREYARIKFLLNRKMKLYKNPLDIIEDAESKLSIYSPSCRFLIEKALEWNVNGNKKINVEEWETLIPVASKILEFSQISDYLYYISELGILNINLNIDTKNRLEFRLIIENSPFNKFFENSLQNVNEQDLNNHKIMNKTEESVVEETSGIITKQKELNQININIKKYFGFNLIEYGIILNKITFLNDRLKNHIIEMDQDSLVDFLNKETNIEKSIIRDILNFSTVSKENFAQPYRYGKISTRDNRLTIKPFIKIDNDIIFGIASVIKCSEMVLNLLIDGNWPYAVNTDFPKELQESLEWRKQKLSSDFENLVYERIKKNTDKIDKNVCQNIGQNDKCLSKVKEYCPGQIDVISYHPKSKTIILWEAKNINIRFGSMEIISDIKNFTKEEGEISKLKTKEDYIRRNLESVLDYYDLSNKNEWDVKSVFVFSDLYILKFLLENKANTIFFNEIEKFLSL